MKNLIQIVSLFLLIISGVNISYAQNSDNHEMGSRFYVGGNFGVQLGTVTLIDISPLIGYRLTEKFNVGAGVSYQYYRDSRWGVPYETNIYGGRAFASYYIFRDIFAHAEYELLSLEAYDSQLNEFFRKNVHGLLVGGGYRQWVGQRLFMNIMVLWNLNETIDYPYNNPIFRVGIGVGL